MSRGVVGGTRDRTRAFGTSWWDPNEAWKLVTGCSGESPRWQTPALGEERTGTPPSATAADLKLGSDDARLGKSANRGDSGQEASGDGVRGDSAGLPWLPVPGKGTPVSAAGRAVHRGAWGSRASVSRRGVSVPRAPESCCGLPVGCSSQTRHLLRGDTPRPACSPADEG